MNKGEMSVYVIERNREFVQVVLCMRRRVCSRLITASGHVDKNHTILPDFVLFNNQFIQSIQSGPYHKRHVSQ